MNQDNYPSQENSGASRRSRVRQSNYRPPNEKSGASRPAVKGKDPAVKGKDPVVKEKDPAVKEKDPAVKKKDPAGKTPSVSEGRRIARPGGRISRSPSTGSRTGAGHERPSARRPSSLTAEQRRQIHAARNSTDASDSYGREQSRESSSGTRSLSGIPVTAVRRINSPEQYDSTDRESADRQYGRTDTRQSRADSQYSSTDRQHRNADRRPGDAEGRKRNADRRHSDADRQHRNADRRPGIAGRQHEGAGGQVIRLKAQKPVQKETPPRSPQDHVRLYIAVGLICAAVALCVILGIVLYSRLSSQPRTTDTSGSYQANAVDGGLNLKGDGAFLDEGPGSEKTDGDDEAGKNEEKQEPAESDQEETEEPEPEEEPEPAAPEEEEIDFSPHSVESTKPSNLISSTDIMVGDEILSSASLYQAKDPLSFGVGSTYTDMEGVITFRGNNFRSMPAYGTADIKNNKLNNIWTKETGALMSGDAYWSGSGWTGQPLIVRWPKELRSHMNMYDWAKQQEDLVEVIYACMDGYVYFLEMQTGKETRDSLYLGYTFKGAGALDPRGYPIMYVGSGYDSNEGTSRAFILNLLDCSVMLTFGNDDPFSLRGHLSYFDSSAIVCAEADTLIYPGENGILYIIKLNTQYNEAAGTLSISPEFTRWRYWGTRSDAGSFWIGMEDSACIYRNYIFMCDNGGNMMCLNLDNLELVWVQDILDDSNGSPVLSIEDGHLYLYISTSFHLGWRSNETATVPIWKLDAGTGEIIWQTDYTCYSESGVSGGVQSTIALGKYDLSENIYVTVSRTGGMYDGVLTCLDKNTGRINWEHKGFYAWSSPLCMYNEDGSGKVVYCTCGGTMYLLDGLTGTQLDSFDFGEDNVEASPAAFDSYVVIGTRNCKICGFEIS